VRIDHAMGLMRLWLIPQGAFPTDGAYLTYPLDDLLRLVALESHRHRAIVIGEDLGTVPPEFRARMAEAGISGMDVLWFQRDKNGFLPPSRWRHVTSPPRLILLEGWCIGVPAESARALARAVNSLERTEDADAHWRTWVNARLVDEYTALWRELDALILLAAPSFEIVSRWRDEPERALRKRGAPRAMSRATLRRFLMHYERLSRHALRTLPALADIVVTLDVSRRVEEIRVSARAPRRPPSRTRAPRSRLVQPRSRRSASR